MSAPATTLPAPQAPETPPAKPAPSALAQMMAAPHGELAKALARAVASCHAVEKTSRNDYHKYDYASADTIIDEGRKALAAAELVLLPLEATLDGSERDGPDRFELRRTFLLVHSSGQSAPLHVCWPVCPEKGRPLDKATAAADTLSLSYLLRDLLMMPRVAPEDDVAARDDRSANGGAQQAAPAKAAPRPGASREASLQAAAKKYRREWRLPQLVAQVRGKHQGTDELTDEQAKWVLGRLAMLHRRKDEPPETGQALFAWLEEVEAHLMHDGLCGQNDVFQALRLALDPAGQSQLPPWKDGWQPEHVAWAWQQVTEWAKARRAAKATPPAAAPPQSAA